MHCTNKHHGNEKIKSHNHNYYPLLYKLAEQQVTKFEQIFGVPELLVT